MIYKNGERMRDLFGPFCFYCSLVFYILGTFLIKQFHALALVGYAMIIANSALRASLAIYLTIRPVARKGYGSIAHEAKPNRLLTRGP